MFNRFQANCLILIRSTAKYRFYSMAEQLFGCDFEVFGLVQGVFFRKVIRIPGSRNCHNQATKLGLSGWCMNTPQGTVKGQLEGAEKGIKEMQIWLREKGSPNSKIEKAIFSEIKLKDKSEFSNFEVVRKAK